MSGSTTRFLLAALLIASTAVFLQARRQGEVFPSRLPLDSFPEQLAHWSGTDRSLDKSVLDILGPGDFLLRDYQDLDSAQPDINLWIAYFPSQRAGDTIHSPQHCLPGAGWSWTERKHITLTIPGHAPFPANRAIIANGEDRRLVLYWYWAHDRGVASEYWAKYYLVKDSMQLNRSDGALIRIMTPMYAHETAESAEQRILPFLNHVLPLLNDYIPR